MLPCRAWVRNPLIWTAVFAVLGLALRTLHYVRNPSMWHDEGMIVFNILHKDFAGLVGPLDYAQSAPPLFLWAEKAALLLLGDSTYALRLLPFLASCVALLLFVPLARHVLAPPAVPWAILFVACSDKLLWHACEVKPYSSDVLTAVVLALLFQQTRGWSLVRRLMLFSFVAPVVIFLVYPGCFLCGGLLIALLPAVISERRPGVLLAYGLLALSVLASFAVLALGPAAAQRYPDTVAYWFETTHFPRWERPWSVPGWAFAHTLELFRYCCYPTGNVLALFVVAGALYLWKCGPRDLWLLLVVPILLALLAALLIKYPYGGLRQMVYAAPAVVLFLAAVIPPVLDWLWTRQRLLGTAVAVLFLYPLGLSGYRVAVPWHRPDCAGAAAYVLTHREETDLIHSNCPEYQYYFRHLKSPIASLPEEPPAGGRCWLIVAANRPADQRWLDDALASGTLHARQQQSFTSTTVVLVENP